MKKYILLSFGIILFIQYGLSQTAVPPATGDGSQGNPYQIATLENLYWIAADSVNWKYNYIQTADINASGTSTWFGGQGWMPIYNYTVSTGYTNSFTGSYNGQGHVIESLFINRPNEILVGLFGYSAGMISNLGVVNVNITGGSQVGGIVGWGYVKNCFSTGYIKSTMNYSGLDGAGGLVGTGTVENCYSTASVNSFNCGGGLVGNSSGPILNSYANGTVSGGVAGGLVGISSFLIMNSYSRGTVNGSYISGGLVGSNLNSLILNCYAAGKVNGAELVGGLIGDTISGFVYNSYWDIDSTGQTKSIGGKGKTTVELRNPSLFTNSPWDSSIWSMDAGFNNGYPYLSWQNPGGTPLPEEHIIAPSVGDGTKGNPFRISTLENLYWLALNQSALAAGYYFIQDADINASRTRKYGDGEGWVPIGNAFAFAFGGTYNGNGHTIDSLFISRPSNDFQGLFGGTYPNSVIDSIGVINVDITGNNHVAGLCGFSYVSTRNCYSTGKVHGMGSDIGGLVGSGYFDTVSNCYSRVNVNGTNNVGGLIGNCIRGSIVDHSYSTGAIYGNGNVGGLIGISTSFPVAVVTFSFWDTLSSGQSKSTGGVGKSTAEMKSTGIFSDVGWSPVLWYMDSTFNDGYPYLSWQNPGGTPIPLIAKLSMSRTINIGFVTIDSSESIVFNILNSGFDTLRITKIVSTNKRFTLTYDTIKIAPSAKILLWVTITLQDTSSQTGNIIFTSNALSSPDTLTISVKGATLTSVINKPDIPSSFLIGQNYPNPFNPSTRIEYNIPRSTFVSLKVYDILGREVAHLVNEVKQPGRYSIQFDGANLPSGIYFYSITTKDFKQVKKMVMLK